MKKHETVPQEPTEKPVPILKPEIIRSTDPGTKGVPDEYDESIPVESPPLKETNENSAMYAKNA